ncbi:DUF3558 domain-containing protein [Streptomyces sp. NPDC098789]|uniref:DUF3558 domain-containing protein n=1 Tax=Streptomyces sp. NPDC098789 TaxID=3366098 RepID=UPI0038268923
MQRNAVRQVLPGILMLTALMAGCSGGAGVGDTSDSKAGGATPVAAPPGKYRSLPSPCKAVDAKRLKAMLPAAATLTPEQRDQLYAGNADTSYDGDRRVGCRWKAQTPEETRLLSVGFERVVSYDRAASSDDDKAKQVYERRLTDAHLPAPVPSTNPPPGATTSPAGTTPAPGPDPGAAAVPSTTPSTAPSTAPSTTPAAPPAGAPAGAPAGSPVPSATPTPPELGSRVLDSLGDAAFVEDRLSAAGSAAQSRTVRIVFRTANVIVTVEYSVQPALPGGVPSSAETQDEAHQLAEALVERFND